MIAENIITRRRFVLSYDLKDSNEYDGDYREKLLSFLLWDGINWIKPLVGSTIYFACPPAKNIDYWHNLILQEELDNDIWFTLNEIAQNDDRTCRHIFIRERGLRIGFEEVLNRVQNNLVHYHDLYF